MYIISLIWINCHIFLGWNFFLLLAIISWISQREKGKHLSIYYPLFNKKTEIILHHLMQLSAVEVEKLSLVLIPVIYRRHDFPTKEVDWFHFTERLNLKPENQGEIFEPFSSPDHRRDGKIMNERSDSDWIVLKLNLTSDYINNITPVSLVVLTFQPLLPIQPVCKLYQHHNIQHLYPYEIAFNYDFS